MSRMKIYLAAAFNRRAQIESAAVALCAAGYDVVSSWFAHEYFDVTSDDKPVEVKHILALTDLRQINMSDVLIYFCEPIDAPAGVSGGRHVEFGFALASGLEIILVGSPENLFHYCPSCKHADTVIDAFPLLQEIAKCHTRTDPGTSQNL